MRLHYDLKTELLQHRLAIEVAPYADYLVTAHPNDIDSGLSDPGSGRRQPLKAPGVGAPHDPLDDHTGGSLRIALDLEAEIRKGAEERCRIFCNGTAGQRPTGRRVAVGTPSRNIRVIAVGDRSFQASR